MGFSCNYQKKVQFGGVADFNRKTGGKLFFPNINKSTIMKACYLDVIIEDEHDKLIIENAAHVIKSIYWELGCEIAKKWTNTEDLKLIIEPITGTRKKVRIIVPWITSNGYFPTTYLNGINEIGICVEFADREIPLSYTEDAYIVDTFISLYLTI